MSVSLKPEFTPRIDLGHVLQALVIVVTIGGGWWGVYASLENQISAEAIQQASEREQLLQQGAAIRQIQDDQRRLADTINGNLQKLSDALGDLRVLVAKDGRVR